MVWGFLFASVIYILARKYSLIQTTLLSWIMVFVMMWMVVWNVGVLPVKMLWFNAPLSILETGIAAYICRYFIIKSSVKNQ
jgi:hypothetical protein